MSTATFRDRVADYLRARPCEWIDAQVFMQIGGRCAWRTRISNARKQLNMNIQNRTRKVQTPNGPITVSEYRFIPNTLIELAERAS